MAASEDSLPELLCQVDFPLYCVANLSPRHLIVGGGGGAAKTGVKNGFEIFELSHDGSKTCAESVSRFITDEFAAMNLAVGAFDASAQSNAVAVGQNEHCQIYRVTLNRNRGFEVAKEKSVQTDYNTSEAFQKCVRLSPNGALMATGGDDGFLRIWSFPDLYRTHEIEAHEKEIDDLDFSPDGSKVVTISKDRRAYVWDAKKGKKFAEMGWDGPKKGVKYLFKRVRFARVEGDLKRSKVFTISNPIGASKPPSFLQRWETKSFTTEQVVPFEGSLSALSVSDSGDFVAVGTMFDGAVEILTSFNLRRVKRVEKAHSTFITGLSFLSSHEDADVIRGYSDVSVVSISVDHQICIHHVPRMRTISMTMAALILAALLVIVFSICSYLGL